MRKVRLIQNFRNEHYRPTRRTIADGLAMLERELGAKAEAGRCHLYVPRSPDGRAQFAAIWFRPTDGDDLVITYPSSKGCWARTSSGATVYFSLDQLDGALLDEEGNVTLGDGRSLHALEFDVLPHPQDFTDLEHAIVLLTVRLLNAEATCIRCVPEAGYWWIDYSRLREISVRNVKELALYIDAQITLACRETGSPPLGPIPLAKIQNTLSLAGIRKVRGRKPKMAA
jgi:hypothetical protein